MSDTLISEEEAITRARDALKLFEGKCVEQPDSVTLFDPKPEEYAEYMIESGAKPNPIWCISFPLVNPSALTERMIVSVDQITGKTQAWAS